MSRIDEALKRANPAAPETHPTSAGQMFRPAWTVVEGGDSESGPRPEPTPVLSLPAVGDAAPRGLVSFSSRWQERLATGPGADPALTEQFRRLAATLHHAHQGHGLRSVMVTSASPDEGKTLTAVNLALVLAESYRYRVLLVDADLRRPSIPNVVENGDGSCGLSEALTAPTEQKLTLVPITSRLTLLPAGRPVSNSIEALTSPRMRQILDEANRRFDWVVLDAPPVGPATDARLLGQMVGGTLFVIHSRHTQHPDVAKAIEAIGREQILGVVLNGVADTGVESYDYGTLKD